MSVDRRDIEAPLRTQSQWMLVGLAGLIAAMVISLLLVGKRITGPIHNMAKRLSAIDSADALNSELPTEGPHEIEDLRDEF